MGAAFASAGLASKVIGATTMANDPAFRTKPILHYLLYIVLIGIGVAVLIYLLMHAHPMISPKVTDRGTS